MNTENLSTLKIHKLTQEQYDRELEAGRIDPSALYLTPDDTKAKAGFIYPLASDVVPDGFLLCDGKAYSRAEYPELFAVIGTIYGSGDGSTTFNVPNLETRVPVGKGSGYALGATGGEAAHTLTVNEMPKHNHSLTRVYGNVTTSPAFEYVWGEDYYRPQTVYNSTGETGGSQAHNNMQPYTVVNYIIATGKNTGVSVHDVIMGAQALPLGIEYGGTGATDIETARKNLGITDGKTLTQHLTEEDMILSSRQYGDTLPDPGTPGRIFFLKVSG